MRIVRGFAEAGASLHIPPSPSGEVGGVCHILHLLSCIPIFLSPPPSPLGEVGEGGGGVLGGGGEEVSYIPTIPTYLL